MITGTEVYVIRCRANGRMLVGAGQAGLRVAAHLGASRKKANAHFQHALAKYGREEFSVHSWDTGSAKKASLAEEWIINFFGGPNSKLLFNMRCGGDEHGYMSDETRAKLSRALSGVPKSESHKAAVSAGLKSWWKTRDDANYGSHMTGGLFKGRRHTDKTKHLIGAKTALRHAKNRAKKSARGERWVLRWDNNKTKEGSFLAA